MGYHDNGDADDEEIEDVEHAPVDSKVPVEVEGHSIAFHSEEDSDASATAGAALSDLTNPAFLCEELLNNLSGEASTESYNNNLGIVSNSESAQSWQLMNLLLGSESPTDAKETPESIPFAGFHGIAHGKLDLAYPEFPLHSQLSSLIPSTTAQPSPPG